MHMPQSGISKLDLKRKNRATMLHLLKDRGPMSRKDIADELGLTRAAVTILTNEMIQNGVLFELGEEKNVVNITRGRKKILLDLCYDNKYALGVLIDNYEMCVGLANLKGQILHSKVINITNIHDYHYVIARIRDELSTIYEQNAGITADIIGIGVSIQDYVQSDKLLCLRFPKKEMLEELDRIKEEYHLPMLLENNVRALAMAERDFNPDKSLKRDNMLFFQVDPMIAAVLIVDGDIYTGANNRALDVRHTVVFLNGGETCSCGKQGCLQTVLSHDTIIRKIKSVYSPKKTAVLFEKTKGNMDNISIDNIRECALLHPDGVVGQVYLHLLSSSGLIFSNLITLFDPDQVVLYGTAFENQLFRNKVLEIISEIHSKANNRIAERIKISMLHRGNKFLGACALVFKSQYFDRGGLDPISPEPEDAEPADIPADWE